MVYPELFFLVADLLRKLPGLSERLVHNDSRRGGQIEAANLARVYRNAGYSLRESVEEVNGKP